MIRDQTTPFSGAIRATGEELRFCWVQVADRDGPERGKPSRPLSQPSLEMAMAGVCVLLQYGCER